MKITIIGTGYVGLVSGTCFAEMGHSVLCMDKDEFKVSSLKRNELPIWEPGLEEILRHNSEQGRLEFTSDISYAVSFAEIIFIAVGTPSDEDGSADLHHVLDVAEKIAQFMTDDKIIVDKSTVPVGTADLVATKIKEVLRERSLDISFEIVSNPEFLKEGAAIEDFMKPDRIIIGVDSEYAAMKMKELYAPFNVSSDRVIVMTVKAAEMTKYAANAMLATKISFINEIALICDKLKVDVSEIRHGIGSDSRIGYKFIYPGVGYGGSCFPKDVKALIHMARVAGVEPDLLAAVERRNNHQKLFLFEKIHRHFKGNLRGRIFGVWGLSFKPQTDDMREAPSIVIINQLLKAGACVRAYDPVAVNEAKRYLPTNERMQYIYDQYKVLEDASALLLITEWHQFRNPDFGRIKQLMNTPVLFDGRNQYDPKILQKLGFCYYGVGR